MTGESARDRAVTALALFSLSVLVHAATIPVSLGSLGALLLRNDVLALSPNTTFVYDDVPAIEQNKWIIDPSTDWRELFTTRDFWGGELALTTSHKSYRPVTSLTYRLQVLWGSGSGGGSGDKDLLYAIDPALLTCGTSCTVADALWTIDMGHTFSQPVAIGANGHLYASQGDVLYAFAPVKMAACSETCSETPRGTLLRRAASLDALLGRACLPLERLHPEHSSPLPLSSTKSHHRSELVIESVR